MLKWDKTHEQLFSQTEIATETSQYFDEQYNHTIHE